ncbi:protein SCAR2-like [Henckelia pumila]|uniref:protein SCAR2-like n=1 Tax=Henckelia pumila TaxID=405737 RepID=UPI003C6EA3A0
MPISRYEIRNEFTLADPELYRAADKDDPEALLEGVAMAGLVGVLRQLGDLAEFAAEIFHDLHEEVMATSARGHSLMTRVQQLEADFPLIEKAFLRQMDHSSFPYNTGVDWHHNPRMDQNLVTQGDLPRFVMDSYEECRGPPRLFLLDKYDVAGAGACLKRYTDPSFFKVEISSFGMGSADVQRKKKVLKAKKKGSRWRNGDTTPEVLTSHVKLDQLFMKERIENGVSYPARRVKLKRRLNEFSLDSKPGKSYMEKLLEITSIDDKVLHEVSTKSLTLPTNSLNDSDLEVVGCGLMSPDRESVERKRSPPTSPHIQEIIHKPSMYKPNDVFVYDKISEPPNSSPDLVAEDNAFNHDKVSSDEDMTVDVEGGFTSYQPDDISSEMENYVDAPSTMESEMDTDSELRVKSDFTSSLINAQQLVSDSNEETSDANEKQASAHSSDSHYTRNSAESNDGDISSRKRLPSFSSSGSPRTSTENPQSECEGSAAVLPLADIIDILPYRKTPQEDIPASQLSKSAIYNYTCTGTATITDHESDLDQLTSSLTSADSTPIVAHFDLECENRERSESHESSPLDQDERRTSIVLDLPCSPSVSEMHSGYNSPRFSGADNLIDESDNESVPCFSTVSDHSCHTTDSAVLLSTDFLHDNNSDIDDPNMGKNDTSTLKICDGRPLERDDSFHMISSLLPNKLDAAVPEIHENSVTKYHAADHTGDSFTASSEEEKLIDELGNEDSVAFSDIICIVEASLGKKFEETSVTSAQKSGSEDCSNSSADEQLGSQNFLLLQIEHSHDLHGTALAVQDRDGVNPVEQRTATETPAVGIPQFCEAELLRTEITGDHVFPGDSAFVESSCCPSENLENPAGTSDFVDKSKVIQSTSSVDLELGEISGYPDPTSLNQVHLRLDATDGQMRQAETSVFAISVSFVADDKDDVGLFVDHGKIVEESSPCCNDSGLDELRNYEASLLANHGESDLVEMAGQREAAVLVLSTVVSDTMNCDILKSEISDTVPNSNLGFKVEHGLDSDNIATIEPSLQQDDFSTAQESCQQRGLGSHPAVAHSLASGSQVKEKIELPPNQLDEELLGSDEINLDPSPLLSINHQQLPGHDGCEGHEKSVSMFSLENCPGPPSLPSLPAQNNHFIDGSELLKDSSSFALPSRYPFPETYHINQEELPPLPPLPPVQWRMGKLQPASCASDGKMRKHFQFSSLGFSPPTTSKDDTSSSHEELNQSLNQINGDMTTKEERSEQSSSSLVARKLRHSSCASDGETMKHGELFFSLGISPLTRSKDDASSSHAELNQSLNQINQGMTTKEEKSEHSSSSSVARKLQRASCPSDSETMKHSELPSLGISAPPASKDGASSSCEELNQSLNQINQGMMAKEEKSERSSSVAVATELQHASSSDGETMKHGELSSVGISPPTTFKDDTSSSHEELNQSLNQMNQDMTTKEEKSEHSSSSFISSIMMPETVDLRAKTEIEPQLVTSSSQNESTSLAGDDVSHGGQTVKLPRPRNPLIDAVTAVDKSKLRKVTERVRPEIQKVDERDSILEQIRTKSFNLKPALASRPSIRAPKTNLNVAAILEKANAIRQALVDSDEDEDNWSDS